jgi:hypothetical protein
VITAATTPEPSAPNQSLKIMPFQSICLSLGRRAEAAAVHGAIVARWAAAGLTRVNSWRGYAWRARRAARCRVAISRPIRLRWSAGMQACASG